MKKSCDLDVEGGWVPYGSAPSDARIVRVRCKGLYFTKPLWYLLGNRLEHGFCEVEIATDGGSTFLTLDLEMDEDRAPDGTRQTCRPRCRWGRFTQNMYAQNDTNWAYTRYNFDGYVTYQLTVAHLYRAFQMSDAEWSCQTRWRSRKYDLTWFNCHTYSENMCCLLYAMTRDGSVLDGQETPRWLYNHPGSPRGCWRAFCPGVLEKRR